nr:DUF748 domain-containing protein [Pseudodesulfovibrio sp.]
MLSFIDKIHISSPKLRRIAFWLLASFIAYTLFGFFAVPPILKNVIMGQIDDGLKRPAQIEEIYFNPFTCHLEIINLKVNKLEGEGNLLSVDKVVAAPGISTLWKFAPVIAYLHLENFQLDITFFGNGKYSISDLLGTPDAVTEESTDTPPEEKAIFPFALYGFEMTNSKITFDDQPHHKKHIISDLFLRVPFTSSFTSMKKEFTQPKFTAVINGDPVELKGRTLPFDETLLTEFELGAVDIDLNQYWQYVPIKTPLQLKDGKFTSDISLFFERPDAQRLNLFLGGGGKLTNMELTDPNENSVLSVKELAFEMERFSLGDRALILTSISLENPYFKVIRNKDNSINWAHYFPGSKMSEAGPKVKTESETDSAFVLDIRKIDIIEGAVDWEDRHVKNGFKRTFAPLSFTGTEITTAGDRPSHIKATAGKAQGIITIEGIATVQPLAASLSVTGKNLPIPAYKSYINHAQPLIVDTGVAGFSANIDFKMEGDTPSLDVTNGTASLRDISIRKPDAKKPSLGLTALDVSGASMSLKNKAVTVANVTITGPFAKVVMGKNGQFDLGKLLIKEEKILRESKVVEVAEKTWAGGWHAEFGRILVKGGVADFQNMALKHPANLGIKEFTLDLQALSTKKNATMPFSLSGTWTGNGSFSGQGKASITPLWSEGTMRVNGVGLRPFDGYLAEYTDLLIAKGAAFANLKYSFKGGEKPKLTVTGDTALGAVSIKDTLSKNEVAGIDKFEINSIAFANDPNTLSIGEINLKSPRGLIHFDEKGRMNILRVLRVPQPPPVVENEKTEQIVPEETAQPTESQEKLSFFQSVKIGAINITKGTVAFKDESVHPDFSTELTGMDLRLTDIDQSPEARPKMDFKSNIGPTPMSITGVVNPVISPIYSDLAISINGMELVPLTPYTLKSLAYPIEKGRLYADVTFKTENWVLNAENKFYIEQLVLGAKDKRPDAPNVPVEFGLSLLQDGNGNMELNLPIRGELNDPDFRIGGIVFKAIVSLLFKALASPFTLIGSMFGGGENMDFVVFEPGRHALDAGGVEKMETIIKALSERKKLTLEVDGVIDPMADKNGLIAAIFEDKIKQQKYDTLTRSEQAEQNVADMVITPEEYEALLFEAYADEPDEEDIKPTTLFMTDLQPVDVMEKFIRDRIVITDELLHNLAMDRANTVKGYIIEKQPELKERVFLLDRQDAKGKTGVPAHRADLGIN